MLLCCGRCNVVVAGVIPVVIGGYGWVVFVMSVIGVGGRLCKVVVIIVVLCVNVMCVVGIGWFWAM